MKNSFETFCTFKIKNVICIYQILFSRLMICFTLKTEYCQLFYFLLLYSLKSLKINTSFCALLQNVAFLLFSLRCLFSVFLILIVMEWMECISILNCRKCKILKKRIYADFIFRIFSTWPNLWNVTLLVWPNQVDSHTEYFVTCW